MPPEAAMDFSAPVLPEQADRVAALNNRYRHHSATAVLEGALRDPEALRADLAVIADHVAPGSRVLDIGCGDGALMLALREKQCDVRGIEIDGASVERCVAQGLSVVQGDADRDQHPHQNRPRGNEQSRYRPQQVDQEFAERAQPFGRLGRIGLCDGRELDVRIAAHRAPSVRCPPVRRCPCRHNDKAWHGVMRAASGCPFAHRISDNGRGTCAYPGCWLDRAPHSTLTLPGIFR